MKTIKKDECSYSVSNAIRTLAMVGVSGFEPEASWTRTKRDTKLRHTPKSRVLYSQNRNLSTIKFRLRKFLWKAAWV